ncbi:MAG TPA: DNA primase small subunit domain-containing protein [Propionibacteriaceae bacterium]|nr:DNA primase small subunit domain-containing protein [Propionibacteriaceae bacterium]
MAKDATTLQVDGREVRISSPTKVYFPDLGLTKLDIVSYVLSVGPGILAALRDRPVTMERWPEGVTPEASLRGPGNPAGSAFYQKHAPTRGIPDWVQTTTVTFPSGRPAVEVAPADLATIVWMVNLGTIRFHPWPVRHPRTDEVDQLRIDLDPQPGTTFDEAREAALALREVLADAGLTGFPKTSGGRGLHVFARIEPADFIDARHAAIAVGRELERRMPERVTTAWWKEERGRRIFVDVNQMARDRLMASAYSIRPTPEARVSAPLSWEELPEAHPDAFTVRTMPARFAERGDVWAALEESTPASLRTALDWYVRDEANGQGEMPYPPEYPKMPGEPPRVQPSRKNPANWA